MVQVKDTEKKTADAKRNIKVEGVFVDGDILADEEGSIAHRISDALPDGVDQFTIKITVTMPDEDEE